MAPNASHVKKICNQINKKFSAFKKTLVKTNDAMKNLCQLLFEKILFLKKIKTFTSLIF